MNSFRRKTRRAEGKRGDYPLNSYLFLILRNKDEEEEFGRRGEIGGSAPERGMRLPTVSSRNRAMFGGGEEGSRNHEP